MIVALETIEHGATLCTDVCVIGAGAAGITVAREFANTSIEAIVLDSGGLELDAATQALNESEIAGVPFDGAMAGRGRCFGGTTTVWGGQCCRLDASDFVERSWVAQSGWPIAAEDLEPFYRRAEAVFGVERECYDERIWERYGVPPIRYDPTKLHSPVSVFSPKPRLGRVYRRLLSDAPNVRVLTGATVTQLMTTSAGTRVDAVKARGLNGQEVTVCARAFVLCAGGIESARLLLASREDDPRGIGNQFDLVGRYFQDHVNATTARIETPNTRRLQELYSLFYRGRTWYWPKIGLSPDQQRAAGCLNGAASPIFNFESPAIEMLKEIVRARRIGKKYPITPSSVATLVGGAADVVDAGIRRYVLGRSPRNRAARVDLQCFIEQAPNYDSRVSLGNRRDAFGVPVPRIDWRLGELERHTLRVLTDTIAQEFRRLGLGIVERESWLDEPGDGWQFHVNDSFHHMGTTRMSASPSSGVVDLDCRVHGVRGLYVAGLPTFPSSGYANPMLTLAALAIRLADHVKANIAQAEPIGAVA